MHDKIDESAEANDLAKLIFDNSKEIKNVYFTLITDMACRDQAGYEIELENGSAASINVWDIQRFHRYENSGKIAEEINVVIEDYYDSSIKATMANNENESYKIFIGVMNGELLFNLYDNGEHDFLKEM